MLERLAVATDAVGRIHVNVLEDQLGRVRSVQTHLLLARPGMESLGSAADPECGQPSISGACEDHGEPRDRRVGDELLCPVHEVPVTLAARAALHAERVGTRRGLGQRPAAEVFATRERREPPGLLLLVGADE